MPWRRISGGEVYLHAFFTSALDGGDLTFSIHAKKGAQKIEKLQLSDVRSNLEVKAWTLSISHLLMQIRKQVKKNYNVYHLALDVWRSQISFVNDESYRKMEENKNVFFLPAPYRKLMNP